MDNSLNTTIDIGGFKVKFNLANGLHLFRNISGMGKGYLCNLIQTNKSIFKNEYVVYGYADYVDNVDLSVKIGDTTRVIIVDRYDQMNLKNIDTINSFAEKGIVLLDFKVLPQKRVFRQPYKLARISMEENLIEVATCGVHTRR